jgi:hypothetical protein
VFGQTGCVPTYQARAHTTPCRAQPLVTDEP